MNIDIDKLSESELIDLNHRIVAPGLLRKAASTESTWTNDAKVVQLRKD
jgi:hypothetical protein